MEGWKSFVALTVVGVLATGPAWAQTSTPSSTDKSPSGSSTTPGSTSGETKSGDMKSGEMMKGGKHGRSAKAGGSAEHVKAAQQALKDKGHDPGAIDGRMGPKTKAALKDFQKAEGLKATGRLDNDTMAKLGVQSSSAGASSPSASPSTGSTSGGSSSTDTSTSGSSSTPSSSGSSSSGGSTGGGSGTAPSGSPSTGTK